jgi:hypothetical protein
MNIKKNIFITTNVSFLFKIHNTLQEKYDTLQEKYDTLQEKYDTLVTKKDVIFKMEIPNNNIINNNNDDLICHDDTISNIINDIINDIINKFDDFEFIESKKPTIDASSYILIKCDSKTIWSKFTKKFLYG